MANGNLPFSATTATDGELNARTHLSGTTSERTSSTNWPLNMLWFDSTLLKLYRNIGTSSIPISEELIDGSESGKPYYPLSTTIGNYSSPADCEATSDSALDFYAGYKGYTVAGGTGNTLTTKLTMAYVGNDNSRIHKAAISLSDSSWVCDFEIISNSGSASITFYPLVFSAGSGIPWSATQDALFVNSYYPSLRIGYKDGAGAVTQEPTSTTALTDGVKYYCRWTRTSTTSHNLKVYTDSARTVQHGSTITQTIPSTVTGLTTIQHASDDVGGTPTWNGILSRIGLMNATTTSVANTVNNLIDNNVATAHTTKSEANPSLLFDLTSSREIVSNALHLDRTSTTITTLKIRASDSVTMTDSDNIAYINVSDCTDDTWRFILNNFLAANKRYMEIYAGETGVLKVNEFKSRYGVTDLAKLLEHKQRTRILTSVNSFLDSN